MEGISHNGGLHHEYHKEYSYQDHNGVDSAYQRQDGLVADDSNVTVTGPSNPQSPRNIYNNGYVQEQTTEQRPHTSYSDTGFSRHYTSPSMDSPSPYQSYFPSADGEAPPRQMYSPSQQSYPIRSPQRPSSSLAGSMQQDRYAGSDSMSRQTGYAEQSQRPPQDQQENASKNASVVIKVGMVGDAQIGKTSLMVKYVEGSWDEDYIQTLGK